MRTGRFVVVIFFLTLVTSGPLQSQDQKQLAPEAPRPSVGQSFLAGLITAVNVPLRGILCVADTGMGFVVLGASAGRGYAQAADIMEAGCSGPWFIDAQTIQRGRMKRPRSYSEGFLEHR